MESIFAFDNTPRFLQRLLMDRDQITCFGRNGFSHPEKKIRLTGIYPS